MNSLGPSDLSDSGSDVQGGLRAVEADEFGLGLDRGTTEDSDVHNLAVSDESIDSTGTGESSTAGRNADVDLGGDVGIDRIDQVGAGNDDEDNR